METAAADVKRCKRTVAGGAWRCSQMAMSGEFLCEEHYLVVHGNFGGRGENQGRQSGVGVVQPEGSNNKVKEDVVEENHGGFGNGQRERPEGSNNFKRSGVENEVESVQVDSEGDMKRGRPKGSKSKGKRDVGEASHGGIESGQKERPKRISRENEAEAIQVDSVVGRKRGRLEGLMSKEREGAVEKGPNNSGDGERIGRGSEIEEIQVDPRCGKKRGRPVGSNIKERKEVVKASDDGSGSGQREGPNGSCNGKKNGGEKGKLENKKKKQVLGGIENSERGRMEDREVVAMPVAYRGGEKVVGMKNMDRGKGPIDKMKSLSIGGRFHDEDLNEDATGGSGSAEGSSAAPVMLRHGRSKGSMNKKKQIHSNQVDVPSDSAQIGERTPEDDGKIDGSSKSKSEGSENKKKSIPVEDGVEISNAETRGQPRLDANEPCDFAYKGERMPDGDAGKYKSSISGISNDDNQTKQARLTCHQCLKCSKDGIIIYTNCTGKCYCYECLAK